MKRKMILFILLLSLAGCGTGTIPEKESEEQSVKEAELEMQEIPWKNSAPAEPVVYSYEDDQKRQVTYGDISFAVKDEFITEKIVEGDGVTYCLQDNADKEKTYTIKISDYREDAFPEREQAMKILKRHMDYSNEIDMDYYENMTVWQYNMRTVYMACNSDKAVYLVQGRKGNYFMESTLSWMKINVPDFSLYPYPTYTYSTERAWVGDTDKFYTLEKRMDKINDRARYTLYDVNGELYQVIDLEYTDSDNRKIIKGSLYDVKRWKGVVWDKDGQMLQVFDDWLALRPMSADWPCMMDVNEDGYPDFVMSNAYGYAFCTWHPKEQRYEVVEAELDMQEIPWKNPAPAEPVVRKYNGEREKTICYGDIKFDLYIDHVLSKEVSLEGVTYIIMKDQSVADEDDEARIIKISDCNVGSFPTRDQIIEILTKDVKDDHVQIQCYESLQPASQWRESQINKAYSLTDWDEGLNVILINGVNANYKIESTDPLCYSDLLEHDAYDYTCFYEQESGKTKRYKKYIVKHVIDYEKKQVEYEVYYNGNLAHVIHMEYIENSELSDDPIYGQERWKGTVKDKNGKLLQEFDDWPALTPIANDCPYMSDVNEDGYLDFVMSEKYGYAFCTWRPKEQRYEVVETEALIWQFGIEDGYIRNWGKPDQYGVDYWELHWQGDKLVKKNAHFVER